MGSMFRGQGKGSENSCIMYDKDKLKTKIGSFLAL